MIDSSSVCARRSREGSGPADPGRQVGDSLIQGILQSIRAHHELATLTDYQALVLEARQMLGDPWPRSADEVCEVFVADRDSQQSTA